jgi:hypothetical protein
MEPIAICLRCFCSNIKYGKYDAASAIAQFYLKMNAIPAYYEAAKKQ